MSFNCQMRIPPDSKTIAWTLGHDHRRDTVRMVARSRIPHGKMRVRGTSVVSSGSIDRSNEGRRRDGIWLLHRFPAEIQRGLFEYERRSDTCSDIMVETCARKMANYEEIISAPLWPCDRLGHRQEAPVRPMEERLGCNHELDEAPLPKPPAEA